MIKMKLIKNMILKGLIIIIFFLISAVSPISNVTALVPPPLKIYATGDVEAQVITLDINETIVEPIQIIDQDTGEVTYGPSTFYTINISLKIRTIQSEISSEFLRPEDEISFYYGWEASKPDFDENDVITADIELVGTETLQPTRWWRFKLDTENPNGNPFEQVHIKFFGASEIDLDEFRELARNALCDNIRNQLFVIDNTLVFWAVEGTCSDFAHQYYLYDKNPQTLLCSLTDNIAGPKYQCNDENYRSLFNIVRNNLTVQDLGLGTDHQVRRVELEKEPLSDLTVTVSTDKLLYNVNETVLISIKIHNNWNQNITSYTPYLGIGPSFVVLDSQGKIVYTPYYGDAFPAAIGYFSMTAGQTIYANFTWNQMDIHRNLLPKGNYTIKASIPTPSLNISSNTIIFYLERADNIPGFEVSILISAMGVIILIYKRKDE